MADTAKEENKTTIMDLPQEMRNEIYKHILEESDPISIQVINRVLSKGVYQKELARTGHQRNKHRRGMIWKHGAWEPAPPAHTAILLANKQINAEAAQVLYGSNSFSFSDLAFLKDFLQILGSRAQWLHHIELLPGAYRKSVATETFNLLGTTAPSLQTLRISHFDVCLNRADKLRFKPVSIKEVVKHCEGLLPCLQLSFKNQKLKRNILELIEFYLTACEECKRLRHNYEVQCKVRRVERDPTWAPSPHNRWVPTPNDKDVKHWLKCGCPCSNAESVHAEYQTAFRSLVAEYLGIETVQDEDEEVE